MEKRPNRILVFLLIFSLFNFNPLIFFYHLLTLPLSPWWPSYLGFTPGTLVVMTVGLAEHWQTRGSSVTLLRSVGGKEPLYAGPPSPLL